MAARVKPKPLVQVIRPAEINNRWNHGMLAVEGGKPVGYFVRTALKVPTGDRDARHTNHPNGTDAYEEVLDCNQLPILHGFMLQLPEMAPGPMKTCGASVSNLGSIVAVIA